MTANETATVFVTGAAGFIGTELIKVLIARGHRVVGLARSLEAAERIRRSGAVPVMGDLLDEGRWQDEAPAEWVFHLPPHRGWTRTTWKQAGSMARARLSMDAHLLDAVSLGRTGRIVYVADASYYGATGLSPVTEDATARPAGWGRSLVPALDRVEGYLIAGLPIITAFAGWVYGNGSWCRQHVIEPVVAGRPVPQLATGGPAVSPIDVHDCARALVHLAERGQVGGRYFLVNDGSVRLSDFTVTFSRVANRPLRVWRVPAAVARLVLGPVLYDHIRADAVFSNARLRGTGFDFRYPTLEEGFRQVLGALHE